MFLLYKNSRKSILLLLINLILFLSEDKEIEIILMWICRLLHKSFSSAKLAAVSIDKVFVSQVLMSDLYYEYFL
jgi:hypothetical protein